MTLHRRSFLAVAAAAGAGALAACAGPGSTAPKGGGQPAATGKPEGKVSFAHWRAEDRATFDQLGNAFAAATPGVTVAQDITPSNDYQSQALNRLRGSKIGDVFPTFRGAQFEQFVKAGVYADLTGQDVVQNYEPALIEAGRKDGKQWGLPYQVVFPMPVVNLEALQKAGLSEAPGDWDGFLSMLEKLKGAGFTPIAWPGADIGNAGQLFNSMVMNNQPSDDACAQVEAGKLKATDPWFVQTLRQYAQLRPYFQPNATGTGAEAAQQLFSSGRAAMLATGSYQIASVRSMGGKFPVDVLAPITTTKGKAKYQGTYNATFILGLNTGSAVQPAAKAWLAFLSDKANATTYANATVQHVTVKGVDYQNADLKQLAPWLQKKTMLAPRFQFLNLDVRNALEGACISVVGGTSPEQAAEKAQQVVAEKIR
ncbi:ABC transporter substrate-binding protein [Enemella dayhoffiae]|uniref:ABC transporter substrate-binding protein n=1 Tax=Enemella dayhoffiae TaxID=2016507 RepID=A0A255H518_9ACTN|nr:extracellular solute-binding protein [Enemella dayhoffiae]OYO22798.1 ABC transporter substrate-binding protein [Enemella dayhoffiae]